MNDEIKRKGILLIVAAAAAISVLVVLFTTGIFREDSPNRTAAAVQNTENRLAGASITKTAEKGAADESDTGTYAVSSPETAARESGKADEGTEETGAESRTSEETTAETAGTPETQAASGPEVPEGPVKQMIRRGLSYVQAGYGYSLNDRVGASGSFDCSGLVASLLYTELGCPDYYLSGNPYTTGDWRRMAQNYAVGDTVQFGSAVYRVSMKDTEDYLAAWSVPGSIVVQYSPTNRPDKTMGHISIALGNIHYTSAEEVINYIYSQYGILLNSTTVTGLPMVYDQYGAGAGHTAFKINANSVANCVIVDNNFASDPTWIEPVCIVFEPVY